MYRDRIDHVVGFLHVIDTVGQPADAPIRPLMRKALYVPELFAHGYLSLTAGAEVTYQVTEFYTPGYERGLHHGDPAFGIEWPHSIDVISDKDAAWAPFDPDTVLQ